MTRLLLDQGLPRSTAKQLTEKGWDVEHAAEQGLTRASDIEILDYAREHNRVCVTLDADFHARLALAGASRPSTIRIRIEGMKGPALAQLLERVWPTIGQAVESGAMVTVTENSIRVRPLPVTRRSK